MPLPVPLEQHRTENRQTAIEGAAVDTNGLNPPLDYQKHNKNSLKVGTIGEVRMTNKLVAKSGARGA